VNVPERARGFFMRDGPVDPDIHQQMVVERIKPRPLVMGRNGSDEPFHRAESRVAVMMNTVFRAYRLHFNLLTSLALSCDQCPAC
jgi:hypothetical protein